MTAPRTDHHDLELNPALACDIRIAAAFLDRWAEADQRRHLLLSILPDTFHPQGKSFDWLADRATALRWIELCGVRCGIYWTANVCRPNLMKKAQKRDLQLLRAVWADLDPLDAAEQDDRRRELETERERLYELAKELQSHPYPPTVVIDSGNGIQAIWRLAHPLDATEEYVPEVERLCRRIEAVLGGVENTSNVDRVLRLPGTINHPNARKRERGRVPMPTGIIYETGRLYSWRDLEALAASLEDEPPEHAIPVEFHRAPLHQRPRHRPRRRPAAGRHGRAARGAARELPAHQSDLGQVDRVPTGGPVALRLGPEIHLRARPRRLRACAAGGIPSSVPRAPRADEGQAEPARLRLADDRCGDPRLGILGRR